MVLPTYSSKTKNVSGILVTSGILVNSDFTSKDTLWLSGIDTISIRSTKCLYGLKFCVVSSS